MSPSEIAAYYHRDHGQAPPPPCLKRVHPAAERRAAAEWTRAPRSLRDRVLERMPTITILDLVLTAAVLGMAAFYLHLIDR